MRGSHTGIYLSVYTRDAYIALSDAHIQSIHQFGGHTYVCVRIQLYLRRVAGDIVCTPSPINRLLAGIGY